ncbi:MAG TPA: hypothetical protein VLA36_14700 [Longimicrobiales bacterium]|nr:hypothetical protein [Longimicrobiales bacterium]
MIENAAVVITAGLWLSVVVLFVVAGILWNLWHRESLPEVAYGGVALAQRRVRWLWTAALLGATAMGSARDPMVTNTTTMEDPDARAAASPSDAMRTTSRNVPLPFYRYEREDVSLGGVAVASREMTGFVLPTPLLWALLAYLFLVVRFNPDSRWTRRILHGRKRNPAT